MPVAAPLLVQLQRGSLDTRLAEGADPASDPLLALRARRLTSQRSRRRIAGALSSAIRSVEGPRGLTPAVPVSRRAVESARGALQAVVDRLNDSEPVGAQGVVLARRLLTEPVGPLYQYGGDNALWGTASDAFRGLEEGPRGI